jgi:hypothetical protein
LIARRQQCQGAYDCQAEFHRVSFESGDEA